MDRYANANTSWTERQWLEVQLHDADGNIGSAVAAPLPGYSDETLHDVETELERFAAFVEHDAFGSELVSRALRKTPVWLPSARFAIDTAALRLRALRQGVEAEELLARIVKRGRSEVVQFAYWLRDEDPPEAAVGARAVKIKIGRSLQDELQRVAAIRARNPEAELRVDANRSLDPTLVSDVAGAFAHMGVDFLEEPCDPEALLTIPALPIGLCFDETLSEARAFSLLKELRQVHRVRALTIKPTRLGDNENILFWCQNALNWGASPVISHCLEPDSGYRALLAWALLFPGVIHGLGPYSLLEQTYDVLEHDR